MSVHRFALSVLAILALITAACSPAGGQQGGTSFTSPPPPDEWASGLTVDFIPDGYAWAWNEGHETAKFHVFQTVDGSGELAVSVQMSPPPEPEMGEPLTRSGRELVVYDEGSRIRVTEDVGNDTRIDVLSGSLDQETLLQVAESIIYEPVEATTELTAPPGGLVVPECVDGSLCGDMFVLDTGDLYDMTCSNVIPSFVTDAVLGTGDFFGQVTVNAIAGFPTDVVVAVSGPGQGLCVEPVNGEWWLAYVPGASAKGIKDAICTVADLSDTERQSENC